VPRSAGDSWDIVTSVGATALAVATMRAIEARKHAPLARDDYAQHFVAATAAQAPVFSELLNDPAAAEEPDVDMFSRGMGARTRYFDEFFAAAGAAGIRQVVLLAAGLDVRGYRLPWPTGTTVYEVDLPKVLEFKAQVLEEHSAKKTATLHALPVDLRDDWPTVLTGAGFQRTEPTAWLAEGLLPFLPGAAQDLLFARVTELSAPGSRFAVEDFADRSAHASDRTVDGASQGGAVQRMFESFLEDGAEPSSLWFDDERADPARWLSDHGWTIAATTARELLSRYDSSLDEADHPMAGAFGDTRYFTATVG
jgi:methyltransferase (TIGR00027 family)